MRKLLNFNIPISWSALYGDKKLPQGKEIAGEKLIFQWNMPQLKKIAHEFQKFDIKDESLTRLYSEKRINEKQLQWSLKEPEEFKDKEKEQYPERIKPEINTEEVYIRRDVMAWYVPAHFSKDEYGIHFEPGLVRKLALDLKSYNPNSNVSNLDWLVAAIETCFWHEVCHAWIEDLVSICEMMIDKEFYIITQSRYANYIFMEEALCNSSATGMLKMFFQSHKEKEVILNSVRKFMDSQPKGYRDYIDLKWWSANQTIFQKNILRLLIEVYKIPRDIATHAVRIFFVLTDATFDSLRWRLHKNHYKFFRLFFDGLYMKHDDYLITQYIVKRTQIFKRKNKKRTNTVLKEKILFFIILANKMRRIK